MTKDLQVPPIITSDRLRIEKIKMEDWNFIYELVNSTGWIENIGDRNIHSKNEALAYVHKILGTADLFYWVVSTRDTGTPVGIISFLKRHYLDHFDLGFAFLPQYNGQGFAYEASKAVMIVLSGLPAWPILLAATKSSNLLSTRLLIKLGFHFEKELEIENEKLHIYRYSNQATNWLKMQAMQNGQNSLFLLLKTLRQGLLAALIFLPVLSFSQKPVRWRLEKMPAELETDFALSALPAHLRQGATVYLLDPAKGYYIARQGANGFICFVARTEWEWGLFSPDIATPVSYDSQGAGTIFKVYQDVEAMRASGKFTAIQVRDTVLYRVSHGIYKAPKPGISYMLAPVMRNYPGNPGDTLVKTMSGPHYMFYAPYMTAADIGNSPQAPPGGPVIVNGAETLLGERKGPFGYIIFPAGVMERAKIMEENKQLLDRLIAYKPYFRVEHNTMHH